MRSSVLASVLLTAAAVPANALYFYIDGTTPKCFFEELPKDTLVVGMLQLYSERAANKRKNILITGFTGQFKAEEFNPATSSYQESNELSIQITVDVGTPVFHQSHNPTSPIIY
jgi:hypothetical protein